MEYAVKAETKEGDVITLRRGLPSRSDAEDYPVRLSLWRRIAFATQVNHAGDRDQVVLRLPYTSRSLQSR